MRAVKQASVASAVQGRCVSATPHVDANPLSILALGDAPRSPLGLPVGAGGRPFG